jgi:hypothetical protein
MIKEFMINPLKNEKTLLQQRRNQTRNHAVFVLGGRAHSYIWMGFPAGALKT